MDEDRRVIRDKILKRISELFPAGAGDEGIREELAVIVPSISIEDIQRLRKQWDAKATVDRDMVQDIEEGDVPVMSDQEMMEANRRWNQMMVYWECRGDYHRREKVRVANVIYAYRNQQRKERDPM